MLKENKLPLSHRLVTADENTNSPKYFNRLIIKQIQNFKVS